MLRNNPFQAYAPLLNIHTKTSWSTFYENPSEMYAQLVTCKGHTNLITRNTFFINFTNPWRTFIRTLPFDKNAPPLVIESELSHNLAGICVDDEIVAVGGQYRTRRREKRWQGLKVTQIQGWRYLNSVSSHRVNASKCIEKRLPYLDNCEFDSKMSIVKFKNRYHIFARANMKSEVRFVQTTSSNDLKTWKPFQLISMKHIDPSQAINLYFMNVENWNKTHLIGLFPSVFSKQTAGIFASFSQNGLVWSKPITVLEQRSIGVRVRIHPVGLFDGRLVTIDTLSRINQNSLKISIEKLNECQGRNYRFIPFNGTL